MCHAWCGVGYGASQRCLYKPQGAQSQSSPGIGMRDSSVMVEWVVIDQELETVFFDISEKKVLKIVMVEG